MTRILVVEDDAPIRRGLVDALKFAGHAVLEAADGDEGLRIGLAADLDLVLLDVVMPGRSGFEVLGELRRTRPRLPVIMLTAKGAEEDRVRGLEAGADDYVVKPFSAKELLARVDAVLRRAPERTTRLGSVELDGRAVDFDLREVVFADGERVPLSEREAELLRYLAGHPGRPIPRDELLSAVWGVDPRGIRTRTVDMHVARIRERLRQGDDDRDLIVTVRSKGYMLVRDG